MEADSRQMCCVQAPVGAGGSALPCSASCTPPALILQCGLARTPRWRRHKRSPWLVVVAAVVEAAKAPCGRSFRTMFCSCLLFCFQCTGRLPCRRQISDPLAVGKGCNEDSSTSVRPISCTSSAEHISNKDGTAQSEKVRTHQVGLPQCGHLILPGGHI